MPFGSLSPSQWREGWGVRISPRRAPNSRPCYNPIDMASNTHHQPYELIAVDLDGTMFGDDLTPSPRVMRAVAGAQAAGVRVTIATGRMFAATQPWAARFGIDTPVVCYQGAMVRHPVTGHTIEHLRIPLEAARRALEAIAPYGVHVNVYVDDTLYAAADTPEGRRYASMSNVEVHVVGDLLAFLREAPTKIVVVSSEEMTLRLVSELTPVLDGTVHVTRSYPIFTEISGTSISKASGLATLCRHLGIPRERVMAVGDNLNDLEMVEWAGLGVAMGNGAPELKAVAGVVAPTLAEDGAAWAIEHLALGRDGSE
jgi:Cof subfamily protein (haloacid dehalogenase superfamily)